MPTENKIDCPALHQRSDSYPFGDRVPRTVRMLTRECPECRELEEPAEGCEICDGEGEFGQSHMIPWEKIKFIYSEAVKGLALQPNAAR